MLERSFFVSFDKFVDVAKMNRKRICFVFFLYAAAFPFPLTLKPEKHWKVTKLFYF